MATFVYRAVESTGRTVRGRMEGENQQAVLAKLRERNVQVLDVTESKTGGLAALRMNRVSTAAPPSAHSVRLRMVRIATVDA